MTFEMVGSPGGGTGAGAAVYSVIAAGGRNFRFSKARSLNTAQLHGGSDQYVDGFADDATNRVRETADELD